ncbi:serine protease 53-like isoform X2 [Wyeomyia smithii]|uniref:serine protease 53-like isoform X2 n=1 Tax=Wyeomyia smithii TaxID=174621 RepID=UPI002467BB41|nr:serine protease 53-like isoform X2 [Wyeomyia smithii]
MIISAHAQDASTLLMLPNDRLSLDDCHLRYHILSIDVPVKPAFGHPARLKEFAHIGAIGRTQTDGTISWNCGGTLIWDNFVLTAAHCAVDLSGKRPDVIRFGDLNIHSSDDDEYAQQLKIIKIIRHPEHRYAAQYHDIALMKLEKNVVLHETVVPACLWTDEEVRFKSLEAAGWGKIGFAAEQTPVLLKVILKPIDNQECGETYTNDTNRKLPLGLQDHHICAVDEKMDTCEGDSGGPLQIKLMHNARVTPFIVGVTSFGTICGTSSPGVYTKVSSYHNWIVDTMKSHGENVNEFIYNATFCALRYVRFREYEDVIVTSRTDNFVSADSSLRHVQAVENLPPYVVKLSWRFGGRDDCYGAIIDETSVLTLAECIFHDNNPVDHILYLEDQKMNVNKFHIHPEYTNGSGYNNIAILSLEHLLDVRKIQPACIWYEQKFPFNEVHIFGTGRFDINTFSLKPPLINSSMTLLRPRAAVQNSSSCIVSNRYEARLKMGLRKEHVCIGKDFFLVPKSCDLLIAGPIDETMWRVSNHYPTIFGLVQFGRDCGFGEHVIATGFANHRLDEVCAAEESQRKKEFAPVSRQ